MKLKREYTVMLRSALDDFLPRVIRDSRWFMTILFMMFYRDMEKVHLLLNFKVDAFAMTEKDFVTAYKKIEPTQIHMHSDLSDSCLLEIQKSIVGQTVLDAGCGRGFLTEKLSRDYQVTGCDINIAKGLACSLPNVSFYEANVENLPFETRQFDTVVCAHLLEHVQHLEKAIRELRRVARRRLIIVVPKERPFKYTFSLHLHFFPHPYSLLAVMGKRDNFCRVIGADLFYVENIGKATPWEALTLERLE